MRSPTFMNRGSRRRRDCRIGEVPWLVDEWQRWSRRSGIMSGGQWMIAASRVSSSSPGPRCWPTTRPGMRVGRSIPARALSAWCPAHLSAGRIEGGASRCRHPRPPPRHRRGVLQAFPVLVGSLATQATCPSRVHEVLRTGPEGHLAPFSAPASGRCGCAGGEPRRAHVRTLGPFAGTWNRPGRKRRAS